MRKRGTLANASGWCTASECLAQGRFEAPFLDPCQMGRRGIAAGEPELLLGGVALAQTGQGAVKMPVRPGLVRTHFLSFFELNQGPVEQSFAGILRLAQID